MFRTLKVADLRFFCAMEAADLWDCPLPVVAAAFASSSLGSVYRSAIDSEGIIGSYSCNLYAGWFAVF